jgi:serine/threonine-protein kinase HipA
VRSTSDGEKHDMAALPLKDREFNSALAALEETEMSFMHSSYMEITDVIVKHSKDITKNLRELYKRVLLNAFVNNTDDHLRNHGFLFNPLTRTFELSPA